MSETQVVCGHSLVPVVSSGELVASLCSTCGQQDSGEAWIEQGDRIREKDLHWACQHEYETITTYVDTTPVFEQQICRYCGGGR